MTDNIFRFPDYPCGCDLWDKLRAERRPIVVYGMGNGADKLIERLSAYGVNIADFFASDGFVRGHSFHGYRVKSFSEIKETYSDFVILVSFASGREEVLELISSIDSEYELYVPDMPVAGEEYFDRDFYNSHYSEIMDAYSSLADERSRATFSSVIEYKLTGRLSPLLSACVSKDDIYALINSKEIRTVVDAGAYNGDTLREAESFFSHLECAHCIEADPKTFKRLKRYTDTVTDYTVLAYNAAVWSEVGCGAFIGSGNRNSSISSTASYRHKEGEVALITVDSLGAPADYIKYDVEGAELEALVGSRETILKSSPVLLVSLYHRSADIFSLVNYLAREYNGYDFYLRRLRSFPAWDLDLILIPKK